MKRRSGSLVAFILILSMMLSVAACFSNGESTANTCKTPKINNVTVSYLGPRGTYTQEACEKFFGEGAKLNPCETVPDAVSALAAGDCEYAVIPVENTIGGAVTDYVDTLISSKGVSVVGEVELPINQNLLVVPGTSLSEITTVYSHKQGIAQGKEWLAANLPGAEVIEVSSTAEGARMVSEGKDKHCAAIASAGCADVYGLEILAPAIQNNDKNVTRFYVLSNSAPDEYGTARTALIAEGKASDLAGLISDLNDKKITLIAVHDRPLKTELGEYSYLIECSYIKPDVYSKIEGTSPMKLRYIGSFDVK